MQELSKTYNSPGLFQLFVNSTHHKTDIRMELFTSFITTKKLPLTHLILGQKLPSIFMSKCFNGNNYPFVKEVKNTEIAHLFEHIMLEYLCYLKTALGSENPVHNGVTRWNWEKENRGIFHVAIDAGIKEGEILKLAIEKSIELTKIILESGQYLQNRRPAELYLPQLPD